MSCMHTFTHLCFPPATLFLLRYYVPLIKSLNEETLSALRAAGCMSTKSTKTFEAYSVAPGIPSGDVDGGEDGAEHRAFPAGPAASEGATL